MPITPENRVVLTNGITVVTAVAQPGSGEQHIIPPKGITVHNNSGGVLDVTIQVFVSSSAWVVKRDTALADGATLTNDGPIILDALGEIVQVVLGSAGAIPVVSSYLVKS